VRNQLGAVVGAALGVLAAVGIGVAVARNADPAASGPGFAASPSSTAPTSPSPSITPTPSDPSTSPGQPEGERLPVSLVAPGWECQPAADEKFICSEGDRSVVVTVRPANEHDAYLGDPDKASPDQYVSPVHGEVFATIISAPDDTHTDVAALGQSLVWR
jgi:hypothetical protein